MKARANRSDEVHLNDEAALTDHLSKGVIDKETPVACLSLREDHPASSYSIQWQLPSTVAQNGPTQTNKYKKNTLEKAFVFHIFSIQYMFS